MIRILMPSGCSGWLGTCVWGDVMPCRETPFAGPGSPHAVKVQGQTGQVNPGTVDPLVSVRVTSSPPWDNPQEGAGPFSQNHHGAWLVVVGKMLPCKL